MTWLLSNWKTVAIAAVAALALYVAYGRGYESADAAWAAKWAKRDTGDAIALAAAQLQAREQEHTWQETAEANQNATLQKLEAVEAQRAVAAGDSQRLRDQLSRLQTQFSGGAGVTAPGTSSTSAARAAMVLSDMLGKCVTERQEVAGAFDRSRVSGLACEAQYDGVRAGQLLK